MATDVVMPNLGFDTQSARLIEWLKAPGDAVTKGEAIAVIESDKANVDLEAVASGLLLHHLASAGDAVRVGAVIARIGTADEYTPAAPPPDARISPVAPPQSPPIPPISPAAPPQSPPNPRISPVAQRVAVERQIAFESVAGSGNRGKVMRRDIEALAASAPIARGDARLVLALPRVRRAARERGIDLQAVLAAGFPNPVTLEALNAFQGAGAPAVEPVAADPDAMTHVPLSRMRQMIGKRLSESKREAPHFYVTGEFVFDAALESLKALPGSPRITDLIAYLVTQTLLRVPRLNATMGENAVHLHHGVHLALAVAVDDGLLTPVVRNAERYSLIGLGEALRERVARARGNRLRADELSGGSFTLSNMGMVREVDHFTAVINPQQVAILAVGALKPRPVVIDGGLFIRQTAHLTLSGDHRAVDGMDLARFMTAFGEALERFGS